MKGNRCIPVAMSTLFLAYLVLLSSCASTEDIQEDCVCNVAGACCDGCHAINIGGLCSVGEWEQKEDRFYCDQWDIKMQICQENGQCNSQLDPVTLSVVPDPDQLYELSGPGYEIESFIPSYTCNVGQVCDVSINLASFYHQYQDGTLKRKVGEKIASYVDEAISAETVTSCMYRVRSGDVSSGCYSKPSISTDYRIFAGIEDDRLKTWALETPFCPPYINDPKCNEISSYCRDNCDGDLCWMNDEVNTYLGSFDMPGKTVDFAIPVNHFPIVIADDQGNVIGYEGWEGDQQVVFWETVPAPVEHFNFVDDRFVIVSGGSDTGDSEALIYDILEDRELLRIKDLDHIRGWLIDKSNHRLIIGSESSKGGSVVAWDWQAATQIADWHTPLPINSIQWMDQNKTIIVSGDNVYLLDADNLDEFRNFTIPEGMARQSYIDPDTNLLISNIGNRRIIARNFEDERVLLDVLIPDPLGWATNLEIENLKFSYTDSELRINLTSNDKRNIEIGVPTSVISLLSFSEASPLVVTKNDWP